MLNDVLRGAGVAECRYREMQNPFKMLAIKFSFTTSQLSKQIFGVYFLPRIFIIREYWKIIGKKYIIWNILSAFQDARNFVCTIWILTKGETLECYQPQFFAVHNSLKLKSWSVLMHHSTQRCHVVYFWTVRKLFVWLLEFQSIVVVPFLKIVILRVFRQVHSRSRHHVDPKYALHHYIFNPWKW